MKTILSLSAIALVCLASFAHAGNVFINEIDYDQPGLDNNEFVELAGQAGTNLLGYTLEFVNGANNLVYLTIPLPNYTFPNFTNTGWGFYVLGRPPVAPHYDFGADDSVQNGAPDGIRLLDPSLNVVHFVSYEGGMPGATDVIPAAVFDQNSVGGSIGKTGPVANAGSGVWVFALTPTPHFLNGGEDLVPIVPEPSALLLALAGAALIPRRRV